MEKVSFLKHPPGEAEAWLCSGPEHLSFPASPHAQHSIFCPTPLSLFTQNHFSLFLSSFPASLSLFLLPDTGCRKRPNYISRVSSFRVQVPSQGSSPTEGAQNSKLQEGETEATKGLPLPSPSTLARSWCHGRMSKCQRGARSERKAQVRHSPCVLGQMAFPIQACFLI